MKKFLLTLMLSCVCLFAAATTGTKTTYVEGGDDVKVEQVNDTTIRYTNVEKIEICQNVDTNLILIYNKFDELVWAQCGVFKVELPYGDYTIISTRPFTKAESKVEVEQTYFK